MVVRGASTAGKPDFARTVGRKDRGESQTRLCRLCCFHPTDRARFVTGIGTGLVGFVWRFTIEKNQILFIFMMEWKYVNLRKFPSTHFRRTFVLYRTGSLLLWLVVFYNRGPVMRWLWYVVQKYTVVGVCVGQFRRGFPPLLWFPTATHLSTNFAREMHQEGHEKPPRCDFRLFRSKPFEKVKKTNPGQTRDMRFSPRGSRESADKRRRKTKMSPHEISECCTAYIYLDIGKLRSEQILQAIDRTGGGKKKSGHILFDE